MLIHEPVLLQEVENCFLWVENKEVIVDATLGLGWHAKMMLSHLPSTSHFFGFDRDSDNLTLAKRNIESSWIPASKISYIHDSFAHISEYVPSWIDFILYDLGVSSAHYDDGDRGFSIRTDGPLDMRFDRTKGKTAKDIVSSLAEKDLAQIFFRYADEKKANFIARAIVEKRQEKPIETTFELLDIIRGSSYDPKSSIRVFQALRIKVNEEFEHIEKSLESAITLLHPGWRIAVITFHSLEDRLVKNIFSPFLIWEIDEVTGQTTRASVLKKITKKPIEPTKEEITLNPRSRSAKLRVYEKN